MTPTPLDIEATRRSLSERYYLDSGPNSDVNPSPPLDSQFIASESVCHLVNSDSEGFKGRDASNGGGLPSFYQPTSHNLNNKPNHLAEKPTKAHKLRRFTHNWKRHFEGWRVILFDSWLNVLLIMIPIAWTTRMIMEDAYALVFSFCILALIPLVRLHDITIGQLALRIGGSKTGLLNASMSNFVEVVVAISALRKCELRVVQSTLVGSILSKLLLILGLCFFAGGMRFSEQGFDATATQVHSSLLSISVGVLLLPAAYHFALNAGAGEAADLQRKYILKMSHGVSVVLVFIYISYLAFQLWSHTHLYQDNHNKKSARLPVTKNISAEKAAAYISARSKSTFDHIRSPSLGILGSNSKSRLTTPPRRPYAELTPSPPTNPGIQQSASAVLYTTSPTFIHSRHNRASTYDKSQKNIRLVTFNTMPRIIKQDRSPNTSPASSIIDTYAGFGTTSMHMPTSRAGSSEELANSDTDGRDKPLKRPQLSWFLTGLSMLTVTSYAFTCFFQSLLTMLTDFWAVAISADWIVESMDGISTTISKEWVALILLPAVSSIAECITAVRVSVKDELSLSVWVAVGSTIQTSLFVIPFMVLLGWVTHRPLTLLMDPFESLVLYLSVQTTSYVLADGKSNWLEGVILVALYLIIAVSFWFYPGSTPLDFLGQGACPKDL